MSTKYKFHNPDGCYFVTYSVIEWIDVFTRSHYKDLMIESWKYCQQNKGLAIHGYVIMTNHIHMLISRKSKFLLEGIMRDMKKYTSFKILDAIKREPESKREWMLNIFGIAGASNSNNKTYQFWHGPTIQQDNHPIECIGNQMVSQKLDYIHENPVRAGFVEKAEDWIYSSAGDYYCERKGLIDLSFV